MSPIVKPGIWPGVSSRNHANQIYMPASCGGFATKVANLERTIQQIEANFQDALENAARMGRINNALLAATVVRDSCVAFLDLGASILDTVGLKKEARAASLGVKAIELAEVTSNYAAGQTSWDQAATGYAKIGASLLPSDSVGQIGAKYVAEKHVSAADFLVNAQHNTREENKKAGLKYVGDQIIMTADLIADAAKNDNQEWGKSLGNVMNGVKGLLAVRNYEQNLDNATTAHFDEKVYIEQRLQNARTMHHSQMVQVKEQLRIAKQELQACIGVVESSQRR